MHSSILTVCTGNICRSPMAAGLLGARLPADKSVSSAGIGALEAEPADPSAITLLEKRGIDISAHRGRQIHRAMVLQYELILAMERVHQQWLTRSFPASQGRVFLIGHWQGSTEVPDPYGRSEQQFESVLRLLDGCVDDWVARLTQGKRSKIKP